MREIKADFAKGYPAGKDMFYECRLCKIQISSQPKVFQTCECGNISIDIDAGRVTVKDYSKFKIFQLS